MTLSDGTCVLPKHIGIIMDGNGRWAKKRGMPRKIGHREGAAVFKKITDICNEIGIKYLTFYAFSTENRKRPEDEKNALMDLFDKYLTDVWEQVDKNVKLVFLGDKSYFSPSLREKMIRIEDESRSHTGMTLMIAMNYGGRDDIIYAAKKTAELVSSGYMKTEEITEDTFSDMLYTAGAPDVDLMIRTGGEYRLSNFLIWQCAYAEFYFTDVLWPDFDKAELDKALDSFASRKRRFGGV